MRIRERAGGYLVFRCPGCDDWHMVSPRKDGRGWEWNGDRERPTLSPSILVTWTWGAERAERRCHSFVREGRIEFLSDCTHALAGQTVELAEIEEGE